MSGRLSYPSHYGVIATLVRGDQTVTIHKPGTATFALHAVVRACDRYGWKIRSLSSPASIFRDLDGSRAARATNPGPDFDGRVEAPETYIQTPENAMLRHIGRLDLLA